MKAFPFPYVLIVPHPALPNAEAVKVGEVLRVVARDNEYYFAIIEWLHVSNNSIKECYCNRT